MKRDTNRNAGAGAGAGADAGADAGPVDRYLAAVTDEHDADAAVFARCDAVVALIPKLGKSPDIAWAFDEAHRLARTPPESAVASARAPWYLKPGLAWAVAGTLAVALFVTIFPRAPEEPRPLAGRAATESATTEAVPPITNITFAQFVVSTELVQRLAEIDPVVVLANEIPVDARSLAVLPFSGGLNAASSPEAVAAAGSIYRQVFSQLSAVPGLVLIDAATAAIYADSELPPEEIARQLGVRSIVEGRVDSIDGDVRFELRLTDAAAAGSSIERAIERPTEDLALIQTDIASSVIDALARTRPKIQSNESL